MDSNSIALITGGASLAAFALWLGLFYRNRVSSVTPRQLFIIILTIGLACRVAFSLLTPTFYAPDEQSHFKYVKYLAENRALPVQTSRTDAETNDWEYYQPPLYYVSLTPVYLLAENLFQNNLITVRLLRIFSIVLWGITVLFTFQFLEGFNVHDVFLKTFVIAVISLLPTYTFLSSVINNDNMLIAIGSAILYFVIQPVSLKNSIWIGTLLGLALLAKLTGVVYIALLLLIALVGLIKRSIGRASILHAILSIGIAIMMWVPWALRNYLVYGSVTAEETANVLQHWAISDAFVATLQYMQTSFWAVSGIYNNVGAFYPVIGMLVFYAASYGIFYGLLLKRKQFILPIQKNVNVIIALAAAILVNVLLLFRFGLLYGQGQGRFLFPLLIPLALLMGMGLKMLPLSRTENAPVHLTGFFITYGVSFLFFSLAMFMGA
jgi:hypothetical protein